MIVDRNRRRLDRRCARAGRGAREDRLQEDRECTATGCGRMELGRVPI
jgi:hypothetical protein